ncbi:Remorin, N-terminal region [Musa troglodytarum]|uniref:Remorin, N-terminal region n=1 Tax=Musa troglodytarum TaxID=320322 RepID=A0A9E7FWQ7_9LILI|nr:Remorin, N-terminal region [Musa troglodytarum]
METADAKQEAEAPLRAAVAVKDVEEEKAPIASPAERKLDDSDAVGIDESEKPLSSLCLSLLSPYVFSRTAVLALRFYTSPLASGDEDPSTEKSTEVSAESVLARLETEKRLSLIKAWEDNEKTKVENKVVKKLSSIMVWEISRKAAVEAELKRKEEELEKKMADYAEKIKNKIALLHRFAEEKRAMVEARRGEELLKVEEVAAKYRATGLAPKKLLGCFGP